MLDQYFHFRNSLIHRTFDGNNFICILLSPVSIYRTLFLCTPDIVGRVLGLDYSLSKLAETTSAYAAGYMQITGSSNSGIASFTASIALGSSVVWSIYHLLGRGAYNKKFTDANLVVDGKTRSAADFGQEYPRDLV
jgi:hypothetical protein